MKYRNQKLVLCLAALIFCGGRLLCAQSAGTGALTGTITDPSGAVVPNVTVTLTNTATSLERTLVTGNDGTYRFALLPPGAYRVRFVASGFKNVEVPSVQVNVTETPVLDRVLEVGGQAESVLVQGEAAVLQTADSTLGTVVGERTVTALPLTNRNYTQILGLSAGASVGVNNAANFGKATQDISVNGADPGQNNFQMDGVSIVNIANSGSANDSGIYGGIGIPNPDAIQEFKVQTSTYDASYGRNPGGNVNVVTKSGTNQFHGSAFEFFRNTELNANSFFQNANGKGKQVLNQNQFGGALGGPIKKDKLFFFVSEQETRQRNGVAAAGSSTQTLAPLPAGDRSAPGYRAALGAALCPDNHAGQPGFSTLFGGIQVDCAGQNISSVSLAMLQLKNADGSYYIPGSGTSGFRTVTFSQPARFTEHQLLANADYLLSAKNTLAARFFWSDDPQFSPFAGNLPGTPIQSFYSNTNAVLKLTTLVTNSFINEARVSGQRNFQQATDSTPGTPQQVGQTPIIPTQQELPVTLIFSGPSMFGSLYPDFSTTNQLQAADQISWSHAKHTLRAGFEYEKDAWPIVHGGLERGWLWYGSFADWMIGRGSCSPGDSGCNTANPGNTNGSSFSNIYQCLFCVRSGPSGIIHGYYLSAMNAYVQDDWKAASGLTLNIGVRWEYDGTLHDKYGNLTNFWQSQISTVPIPPMGPTASGPGLAGYVVPANYPKFYGNPPDGVLLNSRDSAVRSGPPLSNFGPRIGFAWQPSPNGRLVVRGGAGLFYDRVGLDRLVHGLEQGYPYAVTLDFSGPFLPYNNQNPYPTTPVGTFASRWANFQTGQTSNLNTPFIVEKLHTPLVRQYNLTLQYEFVRNWVLELGYVGASGINLVDQYHNYNTARLASPSNPINGIASNTVANASLRVPYLGYLPGGFQGTGFDGIYNYNSLQVTVRKRLSHGVTMQASYTYSKNLSDLTANAANSNNSIDLMQQYGPTAFNRPQRFIVNYSYQLPFDHFQGALAKMAGGWSISGVTTVQSGTPFTITDSRTGTIYGVTTGSRAQLCPGATGDTIKNSGSTSSILGSTANPAAPRYLNSSAFCAAPALGDGTAYGNAGIGIVSGPGQFNWDISLIKDTKFTERQSLQFRTEFFNAWNHAQFGNPAAAVSTLATFGVITATTVNPRLIQFALKYVF